MFASPSFSCTWLIRYRPGKVLHVLIASLTGSTETLTLSTYSLSLPSKNLFPFSTIPFRRDDCCIVTSITYQAAEKIEIILYILPTLPLKNVLYERWWNNPQSCSLFARQIRTRLFQMLKLSSEINWPASPSYFCVWAFLEAWIMHLLSWP